MGTAANSPLNQHEKGLIPEQQWAHVTVLINAQYDSYSEIKGYNRRSSGAEKRKSYTYNRQKGQNHTDVNDRLSGKHGEYSGAQKLSAFVA